MIATTLLGYALLGLLYGKEFSGYDLRKIFTETPMGNFSDSPGTIYPALRRLHERKLISASRAGSATKRKRRVFRLTPLGVAELRNWLMSPVEQSDVANRMNALMLRFAFFDSVLGVHATLDWLRSFEKQLRTYVPVLRTYIGEHGKSMPLSAQLALESGLRGFDAQVGWVAHAISNYEQEVAQR